MAAEPSQIHNHMTECGLPGIRAILLECAFPNRLATLADISRHLTPELVKRERDKMPPDVPVLIYHVKPQFLQETGEELAKLDGDITLVEQDKVYTV